MTATMQTFMLVLAFGIPYFLFRKRNFEFKPSREFSDAFKGAATLLILYHHTVVWYPKAFWFLPLGGDAFFGVSLFYFISGVGLKKSFNINKYSFLGFLRKRLLKIIPLTAICIIFRHLLYPYFCTTNQGLSIPDLLGLGEWFIISILVLYLVFIIAVKLSTNNCELFLNLILLSIFLWLILFLFRDDWKVAALWLRFPFSFLAGVMLSDHMEQVMKSISTKAPLYLIASVVNLAIINHVGTLNNHVSLVSLDILVIITYLVIFYYISHFNIFSYLLVFFGSLSLPIYLLQLPLLKYPAFFDSASVNIYYIWISIAGIVLLSHLAAKLHSILLMTFKAAAIGKYIRHQS